MNAIELLKSQHREIEDLFARIEDAEAIEVQGIFDLIADEIAVHSRIEEEIFYPECKRVDVEELLRESVEEHNVVKRACAQLLAMEATDPEFAARCRQLREAVQGHFEFEETELMPRAERFFDARRLEEIGDEMERLAARLEDAGEPRRSIPVEAEVTAPI